MANYTKLTQSKKHFWKRWVFRWPLNRLKLRSLTVAARLFQSRETEHPNSLPPYVAVFGTCTRRRLWSLVDLSVRDVACGVTSDDIYAGDVSEWMALWVRQSVLNSIRSVTGSQCSDFNVGVMCCRRPVPVRSLAAQFWAIWSFEMVLTGNPTRSELLQSSLEEMIEWMTLAHVALSR